MSKREDIIAALEKRQPPGAVPIWEIEFQAWDGMTGKHMLLGEEFAALTPAEQEHALHSNADILLDVCERCHYAALSTPNNYWEIAPGVPAYYWLPPDARWRQISVLRQMSPPELLLVGNSGGVMAMPGAEEYVQFSYMLYDAPEEIDARAERVVTGGIDAAKRLQDLGVEIVVTSSDVADNHGTFFNPRQMQRFVLPYLRRWAAAVKALGLYSVMHSDGNLNACLDEIAISGIDALQAVDPTAGMDMRAVKTRVAGRLCLCGNVDCGLLLTGTPEQVYQSTRDLLLTCKADGGLILGTSNAVQPEVPPQNYLAMIQAWEDAGRY